MAFIDHHDIVIGSTDDGHTFIVINRLIRAAHRILTQNGFTAREHHDRTLYLLPPGTPTQDAHDRTSNALSDLLAHTMDFIDLSSTTRWMDSGPLPIAVAHFDLSGPRVTATARTDAAGQVLEQHGFQPTASSDYTLPDEMGERDQVGAVVRAEAHLYALGLGVEVALGIPTPEAIAPAPQAHTPAPAPTRPVQPPKTPRHTR